MSCCNIGLSWRYNIGGTGTVRTPHAHTCATPEGPLPCPCIQRRAARFCAGSGEVWRSATIAIQLDAQIATSAPEIYGHFAAHLGTGIYDGFWAA